MINEVSEVKWKPWKLGAFSRRRTEYRDFIWLIYTVFFFIQPIEEHSRRSWVEFAVFFVLFLIFYTGTVLARRHWHCYVCLAGMAVLGVFYLPYNAGATGCYIFAGAFLPFIVRSFPIAISGLLALCAALFAEGMVLHLSPWAWGMGAFFTIAVGGSNLLMAQKLASNSKLQLANEEIEQLAKVAERERIARDLHDVLGHTLSVIVLKSELASRIISGDPDRAAEEIHGVEDVARKALSEVRDAITGYRAEGLRAELRRAHSVLETAGVNLVCDHAPPQLNPTEETVLSLAVREAVTNIARHAQATRCEMRIVSQKGRLVLEVADDGRGGIREEGNGLRGMRERIESLGGRLRIDETSGTRLIIELPSTL